MAVSEQEFIRRMLHPLKSRLFLLVKLPSAYFSGVRVRSLDPDQSVVSVPFKWFSQNPFRSTYFACQAMAAEMSTGLLAMMHSYRHNPPVSMLVTKLESQYFKKATGLTRFTCTDGPAIRACVEQAIASGEGIECRARSTGTNEQGEKVAEFIITWSFKSRKNK